jgi:hypothetical protein
LRAGGIYVIEDLHTSYLPRWGMEYGQAGTTIEWLKDRLDDVQHASHEHPVVLPGLAALHMHPKTCVLRKA